jgi:RNA recognition motif-containing protein
MEAVILSILKSKGSLKEKKLVKKVDKKYKEGNTPFEESKFQKALGKLIDNKEVLKQANDELALNKVQVTIKRKRDENDDNDEGEADGEEGAAVEEGNDNDFKIKKRFNYPDLWKNGEQHWKDGTLDPEYLRTNPDRITRLFCGNLARKITEEDLMQRMEGITYIKWITDKTTGEFYGSSFLEMKDPQSAAAAVMQDKSKFMGRPLKIYYCPPRPGDVWPPHDSRGGGPGMRRNDNNPATKAKTEKPEGCKKLFAGNLSYDIDDDAVVDFFKDCGTLVGLRWLTRQETGEFRVRLFVWISFAVLLYLLCDGILLMTYRSVQNQQGCAYVEFYSSEQADQAILLDGQELLGRKIRLDWTN